MEVKGNPGNARAGGFFQDSAGTWIKGFAINIGFCTSIRAELWAVITGLEMTWYKGFASSHLVVVVIVLSQHLSSRAAVEYLFKLTITPTVIILLWKTIVLSPFKALLVS